VVHEVFGRTLISFYSLFSEVDVKTGEQQSTSKPQNGMKTPRKSKKKDLCITLDNNLPTETPLDPSVFSMPEVVIESEDRPLSQYQDAIQRLRELLYRMKKPAIV
jgi:hypothetical protein